MLTENTEGTENIDRIAKRRKQKREAMARWLAKPGNREKVWLKYRATPEGKIAHREACRRCIERKRSALASARSLDTLAEVTI
jgi:hypothetical protein